VGRADTDPRRVDQRPGLGIDEDVDVEGPSQRGQEFRVVLRDARRGRRQGREPRQPWTGGRYGLAQEPGLVSSPEPWP
jgi:hypothetical protein